MAIERRAPAPYFMTRAKEQELLWVTSKVFLPYLDIKSMVRFSTTCRKIRHLVCEFLQSQSSLPAIKYLERVLHNLKIFHRDTEVLPTIAWYHTNPLLPSSLIKGLENDIETYKFECLKEETSFHFMIHYAVLDSLTWNLFYADRASTYQTLQIEMSFNLPFSPFPILPFTRSPFSLVDRFFRLRKMHANLSSLPSQHIPEKVNLILREFALLANDGAFQLCKKFITRLKSDRTFYPKLHHFVASISYSYLRKLFLDEAVHYIGATLPEYEGRDQIYFQIAKKMLEIGYPKKAVTCAEKISSNHEDWIETIKRKALDIAV
jgi:hypothetical protein